MKATKRIAWRTPNATKSDQRQCFAKDSTVWLRPATSEVNLRSIHRPNWLSRASSSPKRPSRSPEAVSFTHLFLDGQGLEEGTTTDEKPADSIAVLEANLDGGRSVKGNVSWYKCHSCGEQMFSQDPCSSCGHEFCSKCSSIESLDSVDLEKLGKRVSRSFLKTPRTPRPKTISEETDQLSTSSGLGGDGTLLPEPVPSLDLNEEPSHAEKRLFPYMSPSSASASVLTFSTVSNRQNMHGDQERRDTCESAGETTRVRHCLCCVARRPAERRQTKNLRGRSKVATTRLSEDDDDALVPAALQLNNCHESLESIESTSDDSATKTPARPATHVHDRHAPPLPHPQTPEPITEPWPILRRITKPDQRQYSVRKESVPWKRENLRKVPSRANWESPQIHSMNSKSSSETPLPKDDDLIDGLNQPGHDPIISRDPYNACSPKLSLRDVEKNLEAGEFHSPSKSNRGHSSSAVSPGANSKGPHSCSWRNSFLNLRAEFDQLQSELASCDEDKGKDGAPSMRSVHDCDETGIEGLTIIIHLKGKDDLVINTSLKD